MPNSNFQNIYVVFISNVDDISGSRRLVRMRQFVEEGLGNNVTVIENFALAVQFQFSAILIVNSDSPESIKKAIEPAKEEFVFSIAAVKSFKRFESIEQFDSCILLDNQQEGDTDFISEISNSKTELNIHSIIELTDQNPYHQLVLFGSANTLEVHSFVTTHFSERYPFICNVQSAKEYLENSNLQTKKVEDLVTSYDFSVDHERQGLILNQGTETAYYISANTDNHDIQAFKTSRREIPPLINGPAENDLYLWNTKSGYFEYIIRYIKKDRKAYNKPQKVPTNAHLPSNISFVNPGEELNFDLKNKDLTFYENSKASPLLHDLIKTKIHDDKWKQDNYKTKDEQDAYKYILSALKINNINTLPRQGSLTANDIIKIKEAFPSNGLINEAAFNSVIQDLLDIIDWIDVAKEWFGTPGVFHSLTMEIIDAAHLDLTAVANLMKIPAEATNVLAILNTIIDDLTNFISAIPGVGSAIAAIIRIEWSTAKLIMNSTEASRPIEVAIADMEAYIIKFWERMKEANNAHFRLITENWGKLYTFAHAVKNKDITPDQFGMESTSDKSSQEYIDAIVKAWRVICYKQILAGRFKVKSSLSFSKNRPAPLFNRRNGQYSFSYSLVCNYRSASGEKNVGWANINYSRSLSNEVLDDLFNVEKLNLNPIEFYLGFNGWESSVPIYHIRWTNYFVPVITIG